MPILTMRGPFRLTQDILDKSVPRSAGVFALGTLSRKGSIVVTEVGRSDDDVVETLKQRIGRHEAFVYEEAASPRQAFELECELYHQFRPTSTHPKPDDETWVCPICAKAI
jgi:hypothetical protein